MVRVADENDDNASREGIETAAESSLLLLVSLDPHDAHVRHAISKLTPQPVLETERGVLDALLAAGSHQKATGYLLRGRAAESVIETIHSQQPGARHTGCEGVDDRAPLPRPSTDALESLSMRERQMLQLVVRGHSSAQISSLLDLSPKTVDSYRSRLMAKIGVSDVPALVRFAIRNRLISALEP
jgi:two-component system, NarL family, invasion response regulator UvrY